MKNQKFWTLHLARKGYISFIKNFGFIFSWSFIFLTKNRAFFISILQFRSHWNRYHFHFKSTVFLKIFKIIGKRPARKSFIRQLFPLLVSHYHVPGSSAAEFYAYKNAKLQLNRRRFLYASIRWASAIAPRSWNPHATRHPFFDFSAIQSLAFPDAFFMAAKPKSTYDGISFYWCVEVPELSKYPLSDFQFFRNVELSYSLHHSNYRAFLSLQI